MDLKQQQQAHALNSLMVPGLTMELALVLLGAFLLLSVVASKASAKLGVPALVLFIGLGMLAGSDGPGGIAFEDYGLAKAIGTFSLAAILFAGGLETDWEAMKSVWRPGLALSTLGVLISAALVGWFGHAFLGLSVVEGMLLGAVVSSTDAAAVFGVLRSRAVRLRYRVTPLLEFESGTNDPLAVFLTVGCTQLLSIPGLTPLSLIPELLIQMPVGFLVGWAAGHFGVWVLNHARLEYDGLYPVVTVALMCLTFGGAHLVHGNEFLAVYIAGLTMGRHNFLKRVTILQFHDGLAWLVQIVMFLALGLLAFPSRLGEVALAGLGLSAFLIFVARPISVFLSLAFSRMKKRAKLAVAWAGLRGAVPIILATFPMMAGVPNAELIFDIVFFVVLTSVIVQGTTLPAVSRLLKIMRQGEAEAPDLTRAKDSDLLEVVLGPESEAVGKMLVQLPLPKTALVVLLKRGGESYIPRGATVLAGGDVLVVATRREDRQEIRTLLQGKTRK